MTGQISLLKTPLAKLGKKQIKTILLYGFRMLTITCMGLDARNLINTRKMNYIKKDFRCKLLVYLRDYTAVRGVNHYPIKYFFFF